MRLYLFPWGGGDLNLVLAVLREGPGESRAGKRQVPVHY